MMDVTRAIEELQKAAAAKKCWSCGCLQGTLESIDRSLPLERQPTELREAVQQARQQMVNIRYDCLGCETCYPAIATDALQLEVDACPADVETREGWPPLAGNYTVLRYRAPVGICTLTDESLARRLARQRHSRLSLVGTLFTENLGIERIILNALANPNLRFLIICGPDSRQAMGHLPGQSLLSLCHEGVNELGRIVGADGKRPVLRNVSNAAVDHFRHSIETIDLIGVDDIAVIMDAVEECAHRDPGPADPFELDSPVPVVRGYVPEKVILDPTGYFIVYVDRLRKGLVLEHYGNDGVLHMIFEGETASELYIPAIDRGAVSRLDHAAYLGRELARAEYALMTDKPYRQDAAPEQVAAYQHGMNRKCCDDGHGPSWYPTR